MVETMTLGKRVSDGFPLSPALKALMGGSALAAATFLTGPRFLGLGLDTIESALRGGAVPWYAFAVKSAFTSITLNFGGSGGIVTPIFFVGATSGTLFAQIFDLDPPTFAALGLVAVLAGAGNTPIAAGIMALEMFGPSIGPYAAVACVISFLMTGHRSVYPSQVLAMAKLTHTMGWSSLLSSSWLGSPQVQVSAEIQTPAATQERYWATVTSVPVILKALSCTRWTGLARVVSPMEKVPSGRSIQVTAGAGGGDGSVVGSGGSGGGGRSVVGSGGSGGGTTGGLGSTVASSPGVSKPGEVGPPAGGPSFPELVGNWVPVWGTSSVAAPSSMPLGSTTGGCVPGPWVSSGRVSTGSVWSTRSGSEGSK